jgi:nucleotide-binding universal stress UspA family protein
MISKILIATDGSEMALKASRYAIDLAKQIGASITVLSVIDNRSLASYYTS